MNSRRKFIIIGGVAAAGTLFILRNPIGKAIKSLIGEDENALVLEVDDYAELIRPKDFLNLRFYFVNLTRKGNKFVKVNDELDAFFIVRLPQQHIAEEYKIVEFTPELDIKFPDNDKDNYSKSFVSGFSHLTFRLPKSLTSIPRTPEALLNWNRYDLITLQQLSTYPTDIPAQVHSGLDYPNTPSNTAESLLLKNIGGLVVPVSLLEVPFKIFLSPIHPYLRPQSDTDYRFRFSSPKNTAKRYFESKDKKIAIYSLWSNDLIFQISGRDEEIKNLPPNFKIVGFNNADPTSKLLPTGKNRENLAALTNLQEDKRDIESRYFNISSLGTSTFLSYYNLQEEINGVDKNVIGYKHEIKLGRDNYVEVSDKAIDARTCLKLIRTQISERRIEKGKSLLIYREYFSYLEKEKSYKDGLRFNNYLFKKIIALSPGSFFKHKELGAPADPANSWIIATEYDKDKVIKMPYKGIEASGREIFFEMDVVIILKAGYNKAGVEDTLKALNKHIVDFPADHQVKLDKVKIAYVPSLPDDKDSFEGDKKNNELVTESLQFYSTYEDDYETEYPLVPNLKYAEVYIPQLEGIQTVPETYFVNFAETYLDNGLEDANKTKVFLQTLNKTILQQKLEKTNYKEVVNEVKQSLAPISDVFSKYYKNIGSLVNPDVVIDNLSILQQGISFTEKMNSRIDSIKNINPTDILRGINVEIMGGIDLRKILKNIIPFADAPVFQALDFAVEGFKTVAELKTEYEEKLKKFTDVRSKLEDAESRLRNLAIDPLNSEIKSHIDKISEKNSKLKQTLILAGRKFNREKLEDDASVYLNSQKAQLHLANFRKALADEFAGSVFSGEIANFKTGIITFFQTALPKEILAYKQLAGQITRVIGELERKAKNGGLSSSEASKLDRFNVMKNSLNAALASNNFLSKKYSETVDKYRAHLSAKKELLEQHEQAIILFTTTELNKLIGQTQDIANEILNYKLPNSKSLGELLRADSIIVANKFNLIDDISPWFDLLDEQAAALQKEGEQWVQLYKLQVNAYNQLVESSAIFLENELFRLQDEAKILQQQVSAVVSKKITELGQNALDKLSSSLFIKDLYNYFQSLYLEFNQIKSVGVNLMQQYNLTLVFINTYQTELDKIETSAKSVLKTQLQALKGKLDNEAQTAVNALISLIDSIPLKDTTLWLQSFKDAAEKVTQQANRLYQTIDNEKQKILEEIESYKKEFFRLRDEVTNFLKNKLIEYEDKLKKENADLIQAYEQGEQAVNEALNRINDLQEDLKKLRSINKKEIVYTWSTDKFDDVNLGILKFITGKQSPTTLNVDVKSTLHFSLDKFPPVLNSVEIYSNTQLRNFSVNFLSVITVEFDNVSFIAGNTVAEKFDVLIKDVRFDGPLNFVKAFQSYLKTLDKGLRFDISGSGAMLGYDLTLPNIGGGAFNFVNVALSMELRLPFKAGVPMRFVFGLNSPGNLFLLSAGIFGGRGCFQIGLEPKRGVVMVNLIIEFGGVLYVNLGVANGIVYLFAGIYIKKEYDKVEINGYLTCGGALNILGLITASVTFFLGLRGNGKYLEGYCTVNVKIEICAFFTIKVGIGMYKRIYGSTDNSSTNSDQSTQQLLGNTVQFQKASTAVEDDLPGPKALTEADWREFFKAYYPKQ